MEHIDEHIDAVAFFGVLFEYLNDSEVIIVSMLLEDPKTPMAAMAEHLGLTRERARMIKAAMVEKAYMLRKEIESGEPSVPLRAALRRDAPLVASPNETEKQSAEVKIDTVGLRRRINMSDKEDKGGQETVSPPAEITALDDDVARPTSTEYEVTSGGNLKEVPVGHSQTVSRAAQLAQMATQDLAQSVDGAASEFREEAEEE